MTTRSNSKRLTFLIYDKEKAPYYFSVHRLLLKLVLYILPFLSVISISALVFVGVYFKRIRVMAERKEPLIITKLKEEISGLEDKLDVERKENQKLNEKLSSQSAAKFPTLDLFLIPRGMKDLRTVNKLKIDQISTSIKNENLTVDYTIVNNISEKLSGYSIVVLFQGNSIKVFPKDAFDSEQQQIIFSKGDLYGASRFRPSQANFESKGQSGALRFFNFSRTGDLLHTRDFLLGK